VPQEAINSMVLTGDCVCFVKRAGGRLLEMLELSTKIINLSELDSIMYVRLANISDLVASEGKYHLSCWVQFQRKVDKIKEFAYMDNGKQNSQHCFYRLCSDLIGGLGSGHIYDMANVWVIYEQMCKRDGIKCSTTIRHSESFIL
jgi:hypothetical protein